ncbi:MAG: hypothetical protein U1E27_07085, partial [Kiritimatiellia bacterium]|nr:hypothetical protein [Kiritimatiellia bacterium]
MKSVRLIRLALALLAGSYSLQAQQPQKKTGLQIELLSFEDKKLEEGERPQPANAFVVGETAVLVTRLSGFGVKEDGSLDVEAGFTVQTPDGKRHPVKAAFAARPLEKAGQPVTILDPIFPFTFTPEYHPTGTYLIEVAVTDKVSRATAKKQIPLFAFLTEGSKELISHPTPDAPVTLDGTLLTPGFWDLSADEIAAAFWPIGLRWTSVDKTTMRSILRKATFQEREIADVQIRFENDLPAEVKLFVYNRGDQ